MIKSILPATFLSSLLISTAWALPIPPTPEVNQASATNLTQVGEKKYYKSEKKYYKAEKKHYQAKKILSNTITVANIGATVIPTAHAAQSGALQPVRFGTAHSA